MRTNTDMLVIVWCAVSPLFTMFFPAELYNSSFFMAPPAGKKQAT